ncbi:hypothetical protein FRC10_010469, partial [Ceratobasidium sp. 414]
MAEAKECLTDLPKGVHGRLPLFSGSPLAFKHGIEPHQSLLGQFFLVFAGDELHNLRNSNYAHHAAQVMAENSLVTIGATATPVFTSSKDLAALGRLLRHEPMIGDDGYRLGMDMLRSEQRRRKQLKHQLSKLNPSADTNDLADDDNDGRDNTGAQLVGDDVCNIELARRMATENSSGHRNHYIHQEAIEMARKVLLPIVVRRTGQSRAPDGKTILDLEPYIDSTVWCVLKPREQKVIDELVVRLMQNKHDGVAAEKRLVWKNFLLDYKKALFHERLLTTDPRVDGHFCNSWTLAKLQEEASSKMLSSLAVVRHYDDIAAQPLFFNPDGTRDVEKEQQAVSQPAKKPRKIIIFIMYEDHRHMVKKMLALDGRRCLEYDGRMSVDARNKVVCCFREDDDVRILLISNVGTTGLNLEVASVVIFLSGLWSAMEIRQVIGRCWRFGQLEIVHVYHILVGGTVDVVLAGVAGSKMLMSDQLFGVQDVSRKLLEINSDDSDNESTEEDKGKQLPTAAKSRVVARPDKQPVVTEGSMLVGEKVLGKRKAEDDSSEGTKSKKMRSSEGTVADEPAKQVESCDQQGLELGLEPKPKPKESESKLKPRPKPKSKPKQPKQPKQTSQLPAQANVVPPGPLVTLPTTQQAPRSPAVVTPPSSVSDVAAPQISDPSSHPLRSSPVPDVSGDTRALCPLDDTVNERRTGDQHPDVAAYVDDTLQNDWPAAKIHPRLAPQSSFLQPSQDSIPNLDSDSSNSRHRSTKTQVQRPGQFKLSGYKNSDTVHVRRAVATEARDGNASASSIVRPRSPPHTAK